MGGIVVRGARQHNLKDVTVEIPRHALVVVTGLSGSGKSSLAMDTIFAEGQRRYVESLSAYARQFLDRLAKPDVDAIEGLSPAIAIDQRNASRNPRSTVGTVTEIHDFLRLLYARVGRPHCPVCGRPVAARTVQQMVDLVLSKPEGTRLAVLAPLARGRKGGLAGELDRLRRDGYVRVELDGEARELEEKIEVDKGRAHDLAVFVDRLVVREGIRQRLTDSVETALGLSGGLLRLSFVDGEDLLLSERLACTTCGLPLPELEPRLFSFNNPAGACPSCDGLGYRMVFDEDLVVPDGGLSLRNGAVAPWARRGAAAVQGLEALEALGVDLDAPWDELAAETREVVLRGGAPRRKGRKKAALPPFEGVLPWLDRRLREYDRRKREEGAADDRLFERIQEEFNRYMVMRPCETCEGARLRPEALAVTVSGRSIRELSAMTVDGAAAALAGLVLEGSEADVGRPILAEIESRLGFLRDVGLDYLTLDRSAATLSGGEAQRIRLATQIGASLVGVLYVLDEPSIGLHQRDNARLLGTLRRLRDRGNTVLVVEHDAETIAAADWVVDMGPGAGTEGGRVVVAGPPAAVEACEASLTGGYLAGRLSVPLPRSRRKPSGRAVTLRGARIHNLDGLTVRFPLGVMTCVTGVSGSGKSSLVVETLLPALRARLRGIRALPEGLDAIEGAEALEKVVDIDQAPIGRTPRSNPATYTGLFGPIRELYAALPEARARGYGAARFSFNVKGGRCEACQGEGTRRVEMHFLPDVHVTCDACGGRRYNRETLEVRWKSLSISELLDRTVDEAAPLLENVPAIRAKLTTLQSVGLGYLTLGQSATTLSGGEAQRIKLAKELSRRATGPTLYVLDEPTTGLHFDDVRRLLEVLDRLVEGGHTVVVIEHALDVVKHADWVIDLGPEGGAAGGRLVAEGPPEAIARAPASHTGRYLARSLAGPGRRRGAEP